MEEGSDMATLPVFPTRPPADVRYQRRRSHPQPTDATDPRDEAVRREQLARLGATLTLQSLYRAWQTRRKYIAVLYGHLSVATHRLDPPDIGVGLGAAYQLALPPVDPASLTVQEKLLRRYYTYCFCLEKRDRFAFPPTFPEFAAAYIQALWRMWVVKKNWNNFKLKLSGEHAAADGARKEMLWKTRKNGVHTTTWGEAALKMQRAWRSYYNRKIYRFHRDLIKFRLRGEPRKLLRFINPKEAELMDASMAIHVRFRLGGTSFPPSIFYKVFIHKRLVDMNAFSPRDYTAQSSKQILPVDLFDKTANPGVPVPFAGWYQRVENNGWRPVSDKIYDEESDRVTEASRLIAYHHIKLKRRVALEKKKRIRKIEWMRKMYQEGKRVIAAAANRAMEASLPHSLWTVGPGGDESVGASRRELAAKSTVSLGSNAANRFPTPPPEDCIRELESEMDPDILIKWTRALDFEGYFNDWVCMATSGRSEDPKTFGLATAMTEAHITPPTAVGGDGDVNVRDAGGEAEARKSRPGSGKSDRSVRDLMMSRRDEMLDF
ncbi:hypothetical protein HDU87_005000 [Geranomyces variabilis]|uniref:Uncharacterized protein n=1 Tax=Geranomyces variabilis TaxID=109894 RepID=A0AAD5TV75_9FUNG|nr:hypothetical protein HDU87_005000 [Geranomyces variabilis]